MSEPLAEDQRLELSGAITLRDIKDVHLEVLARLKRHSTIEIDCRAVVEVDLTLIQLMIAADLTAAKSGKAVRLSQPYPEAIQQLLVRAGLLAGTPGAAENIWARQP